jgi:hypothetical protein
MGLGTTAYDAGQPDGAMGYAWLKQAMIGDWTGERTDPWGPPATVNVDFKASGVYSAQCVGADSCSVWLDLRPRPFVRLHADLARQLWTCPFRTDASVTRRVCPMSRRRIRAG